MAERANAILAINGDFYGANKRDYVIKNGVLYRSNTRGDTEYDDMVIYQDGSVDFINEKSVSAESLVENGVFQLFAFGPVLIDNGKITVGETEEVRKAMNSNPRTAMGVIDDLHYIFVVSDGRTNESVGLTLYELAEMMGNFLSNNLNLFVTCSLNDAEKNGVLSTPDENNKEWLSLFASE